MTYKKRTVVAILFVELLLAGIWFYLANLGLSHPDRVTPDYQRTVGQMLGAAMGGFLGLGFVLYLVAAKRDRES